MGRAMDRGNLERVAALQIEHARLVELMAGSVAS